MTNNDTQIVTSTNLFTEIELTDEQLESICGGFGGHEEHRKDGWYDARHKWHPGHRHGHWDRWHHWCWDN